MTLNLTKENRIYKKLFDLRPSQRDGLKLNVHHTNKHGQKIRFTNGCFDKHGQLLVLVDVEGNVFAIDLSTNKFWNVPSSVKSCTIVKFSNYNRNHILLGARNGNIYIIDVQTSFTCGKLKGHKYPVIAISYAFDSLCLTSSIYEAVMWDLKTNTKVQVLNLDHSASLKFVAFMPVSTNILACFDDDIIQIWHSGTFEMKTQIPPLVWYSHELRSITFTLDGKIMVLGCRSPYLAVFLLSNYKLLKFITLPEYIQSVKNIDFIPQLNDGGSNKILAILSGRGSIYFYDIDQNVIISELISSYEISKFDYSPNGNYISCILSSGDVNIYEAIPYTVVPVKLKAVRAKTPKKNLKLKKDQRKINHIKGQIRDILDIEKMKMILKQCGEYPDSYRVKIWERLLELPNNESQYNAIIDHRMIISFEDLCIKYPLENKGNLRNLKKLLDNLVTWCPFFLQIDYLPVFVFPFVKVFCNKPLACFEAVCTVIVNWCQFWFEYFPLPPINVLAIIENVLMEHDPQLLYFLTKNNVQSKWYAWPILRSAFSEILTAPAWKKFWDHILTNEPSFFLCGVVAYNILLRNTLFSFQDEKDFECFYNTHHPVDVQKLLTKTYHILKETSEPLHPRQYLKKFRKITPGEYPNFCDYPKTIVDLKSEKVGTLKEEMKNLKIQELDLFRKRLAGLEKMQELGVEEEEKRRVLAMENTIKRQLLEEQEKVRRYYERLASLRQKFHEENKLFDVLKNKIDKKDEIVNRKKYLDSLMNDLTLKQMEKDFAMAKTEDELLYHYSELLRNKNKIEKLLDEDVPGSTKITTDSSSTSFIKQQEELSNEINLMRHSSPSQEHLKMLNVSTGIAAMDALINKIEQELEKEQRGEIDEKLANKRVMQLQAETKDLVTQVNKLLQLLIEMRHEELLEG